MHAETIWPELRVRRLAREARNARRETANGAGEKNMTIRDSEIYIARDLVALARHAADVENETSVEAFIERVLSDYLERTYTLARLETSLRRANAKRREVLDAEADLLRSETQGPVKTKAEAT